MKQVIYFVRHGETVLNAKGIRQGMDGSLSELGVSQAQDIARRFPKEKSKIQVIISSPYQRTRETVDIIAMHLDMKVEYNDLLKERRNPSDIIGHSGREEKVREIIDRIDKSFHDDDLRISDEENFVDLKKRARKLLRYIANRKEKSIIMVTHGIFLKMIASYITVGKELNSYQYNKLSLFNHTENASLTIVTHVPHWFKKDEWEVLVWNSVIGDNYMPNDEKTII